MSTPYGFSEQDVVSAFLCGGCIRSFSDNVSG
jgi:hypothetical protein